MQERLELPGAKNIMNLDFGYIKSYGLSECGPYRANNEDALLLLPKAGCFFVADGMGGGEAGEVASGMLLEMIQKGMGDSVDDCPGERKQHLNDIVQEANTAIQRYSQEHGFTKGMGSTLVGLVFDSWDPTIVHVCHAGDSRAYLFRNGHLNQLTKDHASTIRKHGVTRAIGPMQKVELEWNVFLSLKPYDILILCSDGMSGNWDNAEIEKYLNTLELNCEIMPRELVKEAIAHGSHDNVTVVAIQISDILPPPVDVSETMKKESDFLLQQGTIV